VYKFETCDTWTYVKHNSSVGTLKSRTFDDPSTGFSW